MELKATEMAIIIGALNFRLLNNEGQSIELMAQVKVLKNKIENEHQEQLTEDHHTAMMDMASKIKAACPWATEESIDEYVLEFGMDDDVGIDGFRKSLLG